VSILRIKKKNNFLSSDTNLKHDYKMVKGYNIPKHQLWEASNTSVLDYFIQPKNNFPAAFGYSKYIDFDLPKNELSYYQFLIKFTLTNNNNSSHTTI